MSEPRIQIQLSPHAAPDYLSGDLLQGEYRLEGVVPGEVKAVEISVLWYTEGIGDEDMSVHFFERRSPDQEHAAAWLSPQAFSTKLPNSPLSYEGILVKIRWCVRVRAFLGRGKDLLGECPFQLGHVPGPKPASEEVV